MNALVPTFSTPKPDPQIDKKMAEVADYLRSYTPNYSAEPKKDILDNRYRIDLKSPLPEFNQKNARAYAAMDIDEGKALFAIVCETENAPRYNTINNMLLVRHEALAGVVAAGAVELSQPQEERFVVFFERPKGKKLSTLLANTKAPIPHHIIIDKIIVPISQAVNLLLENGITHGSINPDNIYYDTKAVLGPCVVEPCGYSQPFYYEVVERMQCHPAGKGNFHPGADYYAIAVLVLEILGNIQAISQMTPDLLARTILRAGPFNTYTKQKEPPEEFFDFCWGMLGSGTNERWNQRYLKSWLEGKHYNIIASPPPTEGAKPYECFGTTGHSRREIAHLMQLKWDEIPEALIASPLNSWVLTTLRQKELSEIINRISKNIVGSDKKNEMLLVENCMRLILVLDNVGPMRIGKLAFHVDGIESLFVELFHKKANTEIQLLLKFIEANLLASWLDMQRIREVTFNEHTNNLLAKLERLRSVIRNNGLGFGVERVLYDIAPETPCLSPLCRGRHITTLPALLKHLDKIAPTYAGNQDPIDNHIAAFLASKLAIQGDIRLNELSGFPNFATNKTLIALKMFAVAQHRSGNIQISGLTHWVVQRVLPTMQNLNSTTIRTRILGMLSDRAEEGKNQTLSDLLLDGEIVSADHTQYQKALNNYKANADKIEAFTKATFLDRDSSHLAYMIAKIFSYMALLMSVYKAMGI